jgi:sugar lactone lactonase YvrE
LQGATLQGTVHGGQTTISGASVYLYAANTTGYGNASVSLLNSSGGNTLKDSSGKYYVTTDSQGTFEITGDYVCPSTASQLYLYAIGGNPGSGVNPAAGLLAALGTCPANGTLSSSLVIVINEVSTVATAYAVAGYTTDPLHISSPGTKLAQTGIANAFAVVPNLETLGTGVALATTPAGNGTVPQAQIDTLANILAACINSTGSTSTQCATLFSNAKNGTTAPTDTATAAINIAHNPAANISALYGLQSASTFFQPMLSAAPNDFIVGISYAGGGLSTPVEVAIDSSGDVWTANGTGNSISEFSPIGTAISPATTGYTGGGLSQTNSAPFGVAIDASGNVWATNGALGAGNTLSEFSSTGTPISPATTGYAGGGLAAPEGLAIDASGNVWVADDNNRCISEFNSSGGALTGSNGIQGGGLAGAEGVAIDVHGNVWVADSDGFDLSDFNLSGGAISSSSGYTGGGLNQPVSIAIDASGNVWAANSTTGTAPNFTAGIGVSEFTSGGSAISPAPNGFTGGGLKYPHGIAIDGSGNVWIGDNNGNMVTEMNSSGTPISGASGYGDGGVSAPLSVAVDGSGNVWVTNGCESNSNSCFTSSVNTITEFVGAAAPVVTPIVANLLTPYGSHAVNLP